MSQPDDVDAVPLQPSGAGRTMHVVGAIVVVVVLPVVLMDALVGSFGANAICMGLVYGVIGAKLGGTHRMLVLAPLVGCAAGVGAFTAYGWWWVSCSVSWASWPAPACGGGGYLRS